MAHRPRLLSDNGSSYIWGAGQAHWLADEGMDHVRGVPRHPQTQGKIERWHQTLKNRILLENYYLPEAREEAVADFINHYNHHRYHESLSNLAPADVYLGRDEAILKRRKEIKTRTIEKRRLLHRQTAAQTETRTSQTLRTGSGPRVPNYQTTDRQGVHQSEIHRWFAAMA